MKTLREGLVKDLPVKEVAILDGIIHLNGIPLRRVNDAARATLAVELALLNSGELALILLDGLEKLDSHSMRALEEVIERHEVQMLGARVTQDETLTLVTKEDKEEAIAWKARVS